MLARAAFVMFAFAWGYTSPHHETFLSAIQSPSEEVMTDNLHFTPLSTTMKCTINLTLQYMIIFTALGICRTYLDFTNKKHEDSAVNTALVHAADTVFYAPMVCLMFVGFRMRVLQLTKGTGNPQDWVQFAMQSVAYAILTNTVLVFCVSIFTGSAKVSKTGDVEGLDAEQAKAFQVPVLATIFNVFRYLAFVGLYAGFAVVCTGVFLFEPEAGVWSGEIPPVSPAVACTMTLAVTFFLIYFFLAMSRTYSQYSGQSGTTAFEDVMVRAADTMGMAPMLCVLFLGARMRALQMDPEHGNPQRWAQNCFYGCTYALVLQVIVAAIVALVLKGEVKQGNVEGSLDMEVSNSGLSKALTALRFLIMLSVYGCAVAVVCSVFTIEHPKGDHLTPELSPTMLCVTNLAFQYFFIYAILWISQTVKDFTNWELTLARQAIESAKATVQFAPMLSVLFLATRLRALQISKNEGSPQGWVQDGMYLATWAVMIQFLMCLIMPFFTGKAFTPDSLDGSTKTTDADNVSNPVGKWVVTIVRYFALIAMLGGVATVITGVFLITPETANGKGAIPVIADGTLPVDLAGPPPSVQEIPGANTAMEATGETVGAAANTVDDANTAVADTATDGAEAVTDAASMVKKKAKTAKAVSMIKKL